MNNSEENIGNRSIPQNAVSLYNSDGMEEFPVLKAFQQYINTEQDKARKRLVSMGIFFGILMFAVIAVFVSLLLHATERNQSLNDRLLEIVLKERDRQVIVPAATPAQDNSVVMAMTAKLEELQRNLTENKHQAEKAEIERKATAEKERMRIEAAEAATKVAQQTAEKAQAEMVRMRQEAENMKLKAQADIERAKSESQQARAELEKAKVAHAAKQTESSKVKSRSEAAELELARLRLQLESEKKRASEEAAKRKELELEAYRREHYPELYKKENVQKPASKPEVPQRSFIEKPLPDIDSDQPITYFDEDPAQPEVKAAAPKAPSSKTTPEKKRSIPVKVKGSSVDWEIPQ